jgi:formyltetrahydrofolate deformylase
VAGFLMERRCNISESAQFSDVLAKRFFMRTAFIATGDETLGSLQSGFAQLAEKFGMNAQIHDQSARTRTLILVSRFGHCLNDLLFRHAIGALPIEITGIVSNHLDLESFADRAGLSFHHLPVSPDTRLEQERRLEDIARASETELIVLARYMQVLSGEFCDRWAGQIINIHHSFLPSFKGAKPYHRAYERGVKLIGATAHYVTSDLDEGPIIEQDVQRVPHTLDAAGLVATGRDVEALVLARAVKWHAEHRIMLSGQRTVVF